MVYQRHTETPTLDTRSNVHLPFDYAELSLSQRIKLRLFGFVHVGERMEKGWNKTLPYYAFRCNKHGIQSGYPVGFTKSLLCPECALALTQ